MADVRPDVERGVTPRAARVPPHNLQAEESLLGAMLLSKDAIASAVETVGVDDFYKPAHAHIYEAITSLYGAGEPSDPVTVAEELRRAGLLDAIGGQGALVGLQANTPATTSAGRYAKIVEEHALLRRMIYVAGEIAEKAYSLPEDVTKTLDEAESMVFSVADRRVTDTTKPFNELLNPFLDRLEQLYEREETVTGLATGYVDLDELLAGLQPSSLAVVGARPSMGKALSLDTPIPTPDGWTTMGELTVGDTVLDDQGQSCRVTYVTPVQHDRQCYEVEFDDGSVIVADADHQWLAVARELGPQRWEPRVVTTQRMLDEGVHGPGDAHPNWHVPVARPLDLPPQDLPVDPYVFGCWLSKLERIPDQYLRASLEQRAALLQGVVDTDGRAANTDGSVELCLLDRELLEQARELVCSLGHKPGPIRQRFVRLLDGRRAAAFRLRWTPVDRADRIARRAITAIRPVDSVPVRCITVDSSGHLYLAGESMIPTHNTAFALGIARHASMHGTKPVLFFSLEMSHIELAERLMAAEANVDSKKLRTGRLSAVDWTRIQNASGRLASAQLFVDDNPMLTVMDIRAKARRLKSQVGDLGVIIVDYIQLMSGRSDRESRQVEVSEISRSLKILARELETPVMALAQLNRQLESRQDKRPMLSDLRESGSLEQDADVVMFLYRDEVYNPDNTESLGTADVIVAKHRSGPTGVVHLAWLAASARFENMGRDF
jgi:replicative DNA helicase